MYSTSVWRNWNTSEQIKKINEGSFSTRGNAQSPPFNPTISKPKGDKDLGLEPKNRGVMTHSDEFRDDSHSVNPTERHYDDSL